MGTVKTITDMLSSAGASKNEPETDNVVLRLTNLGRAVWKFPLEDGSYVTVGDGADGHLVTNDPKRSPAPRAALTADTWAKLGKPARVFIAGLVRKGELKAEGSLVDSYGQISV